MINVNLFINMKKYTMGIHFIGDLVPGLAQFCLYNDTKHTTNSF